MPLRLKVCQFAWYHAWTTIHTLQDIHISKLSRGSRVELLELLQYLYKYLLSKRAATVPCTTMAVIHHPQSNKSILPANLLTEVDRLPSCNQCTLCNLVFLLTEFKAMEGYDGRKRRALALQGGTDSVPVPSWMSTSHAAGRPGSR